MLSFGNKEFRNLQEQVLKNMQNIANLKEGTAVLSEFGIKVVGEVDTLQDLPSVTDYKAAHEDWEYGDAFAIGTEAPYTLVILTRANDDIVVDHWFDIGEFPAPGPQGPTGPQGEIGPQGQTGDTGPAGVDAGFGSVLATAQTLPAGSSATATVTASGPNTAKEFSFTFGIPRGSDGGSPVWGNIQGTLSDQTDLKNALDAKQNELVSGTNIKTVNNQSILGSGNIEINSGVWGNITGTLSNQTDLKNALDAKQDVIDANNKLSVSYISGLATVATTGAYTDLSGTPTIGSGTITIKKNSETIDSFTVNQTADQNINISVPTKTSDLTNDSGFITGISWNDVSGKPTFATVATSGDYDDLINKPTIPAAQVQSDYSQSDNTKVDYIKNKPDLSIYAQSANLATVATSGSYNDLSNKPTIPAAQVNSDWDAVSGVAQILNKPTIPTDTSDLTNGAGYITSSALSGYATETWVGQQGYLTSVSWSEVTSKPTFATVATSGSYTDLSDKPTIPTVDYPVTDVTLNGVSVVSNKVATLPAYPVIPSNVSYFTNDSGYLTSSNLLVVDFYETASSSASAKSLKSIEVGNDIWNIEGASYTAGTNVQISASNVISATDTTYTATSETWTFTLSDGTTTTKTIVTGITAN